MNIRRFRMTAVYLLLTFALISSLRSQKIQNLFQPYLQNFLLPQMNASVHDSITKTSTVKRDDYVGGVSVSPAHFHLDLKQGETKTHAIKINNNSEKAVSFNVNMYDFNMSRGGASAFLPSGTGAYSLSKWATVSPTFIELEPGEKKKVNLTIHVPATDEGKKAAWSVIMIEQQKARKELNVTKKSTNAMAMGVVPVFTFGVFAYQNPPNVAVNKVEFVDFTYKENSDKANTISITAENKGDGIAYCTAYIDLTNLETGVQERLTVKKFSMLPGLFRDFNYPIPTSYANGKYLAVGVLDFEQSEEIQAAKIEFEYKQSIN